VHAQIGVSLAPAGTLHGSAASASFQACLMISTHPLAGFLSSSAGGI